jgi:hypothetical protein
MELWVMKAEKTLVRITDLLAKIQTEDHPSMK